MDNDSVKTTFLEWKAEAEKKPNSHKAWNWTLSLVCSFASASNYKNLVFPESQADSRLHWFDLHQIVLLYRASDYDSDYHSIASANQL